MKPNTRKLHELGQRIWLDNITREMLNDGTLARYIAELSVTGLTSNPTIFEHAIGSGDLYDEGIVKLATKVLSVEDIFFELALQDLTRAADLFGPVFDASGGQDGWVSLEVSPLLANDTAKALTTKRSPRGCSARVFRRLPSRGARCWRGFGKRVRSRQPQQRAWVRHEYRLRQAALPAAVRPPAVVRD